MKGLILKCTDCPNPIEFDLIHKREDYSFRMYFLMKTILLKRMNLYRTKQKLILMKILK